MFHKTIFVKLFKFLKMKFVVDYWNKFLKLNHELCLEDPLQEDFEVHHVWIDFTLIVVFLVLILKTYKSNHVFNMSSKNKPVLKVIRILGCLAGFVYFIVGYHVERCTFARFLISRTRFLTENFGLYFIFYYWSITFWELIGKDSSNRFFNVWFNSLVVGSTLVTLGFWFLVAPYGMMYLDVSLRWVDLMGHFVNLVWVLVEWKNLKNYKITSCSLYVVLFLVTCYSCLIWGFQKIEFMCWVPYGPILPSPIYRLVAIAGITGMYYGLRKFL